MLLHPLMDDCGNRELVQGVYPRVCGVDERPKRLTVCVEGLSPRVRGRLEEKRFDYEGLRFIPACAG